MPSRIAARALPSGWGEDKQTGEFKGYGHVESQRHCCHRYKLSRWPGTMVMGRALRVDFARERLWASRSPARGGGGGGGGGGKSYAPQSEKPNGCSLSLLETLASAWMRIQGMGKCSSGAEKSRASISPRTEKQGSTEGLGTSNSQKHQLWMLPVRELAVETTSVGRPVRIDYAKARE